MLSCDMTVSMLVAILKLHSHHHWRSFTTVSKMLMQTHWSACIALWQQAHNLCHTDTWWDSNNSQLTVAAYPTSLTAHSNSPNTHLVDQWTQAQQRKTDQLHQQPPTTFNKDPNQQPSNNLNKEKRVRIALFLFITFLSCRHRHAHLKMITFVKGPQQAAILLAKWVSWVLVFLVLKNKQTQTRSCGIVLNN